MKDFTKKELTGYVRPRQGMGHCVEFCLGRLFSDTKHCISEEVVDGLTFEEIIGALLTVQDEVTR